jgi:hypothetical protein
MSHAGYYCVDNIMFLSLKRKVSVVLDRYYSVITKLSVPFVIVSIKVDDLYSNFYWGKF